MIKRLDTILEGQESTTLILEENGILVGQVLVQHKELEFATLNRLYVADLFRNRGYGSALIHEAGAIAAESGCWTISLCVAPVNMTGRLPEFYMRRGYNQVFRFSDGDTLFSKPLIPMPAVGKPTRPAAAQ